MQYWTLQHPCEGCGAVSNTTHRPECKYFKKYDIHGRAIPSPKEKK